MPADWTHTHKWKKWCRDKAAGRKVKLGLETCCSFTAGKLQLYEMYYNHKEDVTVTERPSEMWKARFLQRIWSRLAFVQLHPAVLHLHAPVRNIKVLLPMFLVPHFVWMIQEKQIFGAFRTFYTITIPKLWLSSQYWAVLLRAEWHLEWFLLSEYTIKSFCTKHATTISCWLVFC